MWSVRRQRGATDAEDDSAKETGREGDGTGRKRWRRTTVFARRRPGAAAGRLCVAFYSDLTGPNSSSAGMAWPNVPTCRVWVGTPTHRLTRPD